MTNRILQSDIDLARRLLDSSQSDERIVAVLSLRGVDAAKAGQLVASLRAGERVVPELEIESEATQTMTGGEESSREERYAPATKSGGKGWLILLILFLITAGAAAFFLTRPDQPTRPADTDQAQPGMSSPAAPEERTSAPEPAQ